MSEEDFFFSYPILTVNLLNSKHRRVRVLILALLICSVGLEKAFWFSVVDINY